MNTTAKVLIGGLAAAVVALAVALGVVLANDDDDDSRSGMMVSGNGPGMMRNENWDGMQAFMRGAMGDENFRAMQGRMRMNGINCDPDAMQASMRSLLSTEDYEEMVDHMKDVWGDDWQKMMGVGMWGVMGCQAP